MRARAGVRACDFLYTEDRSVAKSVSGLIIRYDLAVVDLCL